MYFECSSGTGKGNNLIVTCASDFAGVTITCTNGLKTYSRICPSSEPYEIEFSGLESGTWTISGTVEGTLYSTSVVIVDYTATLEAGFNYKTWCTEGGVDATQYSSLADVFDDELAIHRLMTVHASADYLIDAVTDDVDVIDDFCANDTAMKWIGLRDYVCDGLTAINGVEAKFLASAYWERYLKDHVPTMTGNTAPYGTLTGDGGTSGHDIFNAFDGDDSTYWQTSAIGHNVRGFTYAFVNPTCVKRVRIRCLNAMTEVNILVGNTASNLTAIKEVASVNANEDVIIDVPNDDYCMYISVSGRVDSGATQIATLQFYGRSLNVSVPVMSSNTAPFGVASASSNNADAFEFFDNVLTSSNYVNLGDTSGRVYFDFGRPVKIKMASAVLMYYQHNGVIQYADNDLIWANASDLKLVNKRDDAPTFFNVTSASAHRYWGIQFASATSNVIYAVEGNFYGVDYSEREFEPNTNKKWLYDHGLELEPITVYPNAEKSSDGYLAVANQNSSINANYFEVSGVNLANYSLVRAIAEDVFAGNNGYLNIGKPTQAVAYNAFGSNPNTINLNIDSVDSGSLVITGNAASRITEWWLE